MALYRNGFMPVPPLVSGYLLSLKSNLPIDFGIEHKMHGPPTIQITKISDGAYFQTGFLVDFPYGRK